MHLVVSQFSCSVSTFRANSSYGRSAAKESESFFAGLQVKVLNYNLHQDGNFSSTGLSSNPPSLLFPPQFSPDSLHIAEDSKEHEVAVHSTVPIPCFSPDPGQQCGVPLVLSVHDPGESCKKSPD